jgi:hypothetical protein
VSASESSAQPSAHLLHRAQALFVCLLDVVLMLPATVLEVRTKESPEHCREQKSNGNRQQSPQHVPLSRPTVPGQGIQ